MVRTPLLVTLVDRPVDSPVCADPALLVGRGSIGEDGADGVHLDDDDDERGKWRGRWRGRWTNEDERMQTYAKGR